MVREVVPGSEVTFAEAPGPTCATTGWTAPSWPGCPGWSCAGPSAGASRSCHAFKEHGLEAADLTGARFQRIAQIKQLMDRDQVDADLRWRRDEGNAQGADRRRADRPAGRGARPQDRRAGRGAPPSEILATLDERGRLEALPFMPDAAVRRQAAARLRRAFKTCDQVKNSGMYRMERTVHLEGVRCDGSAHGAARPAA